jgi:hypothetical protein
VLEGSATQSLKQWDRIVVRVIAENDAHVISGALLAFSVEAVAFLFDGLPSDAASALSIPPPISNQL